MNAHVEMPAHNGADTTPLAVVRRQGRQLIIERCPYCSKRHTHGAGKIPRIRCSGTASHTAATGNARAQGMFWSKGRACNAAGDLVNLCNVHKSKPAKTASKVEQIATQLGVHHSQIVRDLAEFVHDAKTEPRISKRGRKGEGRRSKRVSQSIPFYAMPFVNLGKGIDRPLIRYLHSVMPRAWVDGELNDRQRDVRGLSQFLNGRYAVCVRGLENRAPCSQIR
jgi:hypothetical protein